MELDLNFDSFIFNENFIYAPDSVFCALEAIYRAANAAGVTLNYDTDENSMKTDTSTELDKFLSEFRITKEQEVC